MADGAVESFVEQFRSGQLDDAARALTDHVKAKPADQDARIRLTQVLCFSGAWDKVDRQLDILMKQASDMSATYALWRQLVRAAVARSDFYDAGRVPDFVNEPSAHLQKRLRASVLAREGDSAAAASLVAEADEELARLAFVVDNQPVDAFRDLDDLQAGYLEALACNGKYFWIDYSDVERIELIEPQDPLDFLWRPCDIDTRSGIQGRLHIPVLYPGSTEHEDGLIRVGQRTDWVEAGGLTRGVGCRMFLRGDEAVSIFDIKSLSVNQP